MPCDVDHLSDQRVERLGPDRERQALLDFGQLAHTVDPAIGEPGQGFAIARPKPATIFAGEEILREGRQHREVLTDIGEARIRPVRLDQLRQLALGELAVHAMLRRGAAAVDDADGLAGRRGALAPLPGLFGPGGTLHGAPDDPWSSMRYRRCHPHP